MYEAKKIKNVQNSEKKRIKTKMKHEKKTPARGKK
jgi:hypothetical protein